MAYNLQVLVKQDSKGKDLYLLVDAKGTLYGIHNTEQDALNSKPLIEDNLVAFEERGRLVYVKPKRPRKKRSRQRSKPSRSQA